MTPSFVMQNNLLQRLSVSLFKPVDISFLVFFRIVFGAIMLWEVYRYLTYAWISRYYIEPIIHFTYYGFSWVRPWPGRGMYFHFYALGVLAVCILIGFFYRIAASVFFLGFTYIFLLDQTRYLNHFYLIVLISFLLIFVPAERALSVDCLLRPKLRSDVVPAWTLWLLRVQIGIAYFYGGIAKLGSDWLQGEPMRMWFSPYVNIPIFGVFFKQEWVVYSFAIGGLLFDLLVVPLLLWRRTRLVAYLVAVTFHLFNAVFFQIGIFPWFMLLATLIFFPPDLMRRVVRAIAAEPGSPESRLWHKAAKRLPVPTDATATRALSRREKVVLVMLTLYVGVQLIFPLRHFAYPGEVNWTEEGHNFSWHMKLRTKSAEALFRVSHPASGKTWTIDPRAYMGARQLRKMATHPDMILQFSHYLAEEKRREGYENVEVRALVMASLNGRKPQLMIDPTVDLAKERISLLPARWILPLTEPLPPPGSARSQETEE
jgi:vitamin K-dependent gamma-carboxylase